MPLQIDKILRSEVPHILRSHGFDVGDHPDCRKLIGAVVDHLKALLVDAQNAIDVRLAITRINKRSMREKTYEHWIYLVSFHFIRFYKDRLALDPALTGSVPCDLSTLQPDFLLASATTTIEFVGRRERRRPNGGRRRSMNVSLPLRVYTVPSDR